MNWNFKQLFDLFSNNDNVHLMLSGRWGLEKESLRVTPTGNLAMTPHPEKYGDKINNPHITVDFSESQVELITPALPDIDETHRYLSELQLFAEESLDNELLWPLSMPGNLPLDEKIPIARFEATEKGREKEIYRSGLALRYGKKMQMISGIHYNFSFSKEFFDFIYQKLGIKTEQKAFKDWVYINTIKNFLGYRWLLIYLFGASPIGTDEYLNSFVQKNTCLCNKPNWEYSFDCPIKDATSLRMSRFGYENAFQNQINVSYNSLDQYIKDLRKALSTKFETYTNLGLFRDGRQVQLNDFLLQIENEYYAPARFKQILNNNETMLEALEKRGIEYIELRTFDLDPFERSGIGKNQLYFIHLLVLFCCFEHCGELAQTDLTRFNDNAQLAAVFGRNDKLVLTDNQNNKTSLKEWAQNIFSQLMQIAELLDRDSSDNKYQDSLLIQFAKLRNMDYLPSSTILQTMKKTQKNYIEFGLCRLAENQKSTQSDEVLAS